MTFPIIKGINISKRSTSLKNGLVISYNPNKFIKGLDLIKR